MTSLVIALLAAAPVAPVPRAMTDADSVVVVPAPQALSALTPFLERAKDKSTFLRPSTYREVTHPLLQLDLINVDSLKTNGIDATKPLTISNKDNVSMTCLTVADAKVHDAAVEAKLLRLGELTKQELGGVSVVSAKDALGRVLGASFRKGNEACAATPHGESLEKLLPKLAKVLTKPQKSDGWQLLKDQPGLITGFKPMGPRIGGLTLKADQLALTADGVARGIPIGSIGKPGASPFAKLDPGGLATLRLRMNKEMLVPMIEQSARFLPGGAALSKAATELAPHLTGNVALVIQQTKVTQGLRTANARFFALKLVVLAETDDAAAAKAVIAGLDKKALSFKEGKYDVALKGRIVTLANDVGARDFALAALGKAGTQAHGAEYVVDPKAVAKSLSQVPLLEAVQNPELAGLLAVGTELGPALLISERIEGFVEPTGPSTNKAELVWTLSPPEPLDAGVP